MAKFLTDKHLEKLDGSAMCCHNAIADIVESSTWHQPDDPHGRPVFQDQLIQSLRAAENILKRVVMCADGQLPDEPDLAEYVSSQLRKLDGWLRDRKDSTNIQFSPRERKWLFEACSMIPGDDLHIDTSPSIGTMQNELLMAAKRCPHLAVELNGLLSKVGSLNEIEWLAMLPGLIEKPWADWTDELEEDNRRLFALQANSSPPSSEPFVRRETDDLPF